MTSYMTEAENLRPYVHVRADGSERRYRTWELANAQRDRAGGSVYVDCRPVR
jgi:hypothetical protein